MELAQQKNAMRGLSNSSLCRKGNYKDIDKDLARIRVETMEALSTLV